MSNTAPPPVAPSSAPNSSTPTGASDMERIASKIILWLETEERDLGWLSRKTDIPYSTLRYQVHEKPTALSGRNLLKIAHVIDVGLTKLAA